jgi:tetratricopeptide (TPR) repeat protein
MIFYLIPVIIIIVSLTIIFSVVVKKFPQLSVINVDSIPQEKENKVINKIMLERLQRNFLKYKKLILDILAPLIDLFIQTGKKIYQSIIDLERKNLQQEKPLSQIDINQQITEKHSEAQQAITGKDFEKAEELGIAIIKLNPKNLEAYQLLVTVYLELKDYRKARETCRYLIKLLLKLGAEQEGNTERHHLANSYADLGWIYQLEKKNNYALLNYQKAVDLESNNPRFLDLLLKISIMLKNKNLALQVFENLKNADPENQKLPELEQEINELSELEKTEVKAIETSDHSQ